MTDDIGVLISWLRIRQECESRVANTVSGAGEAAERYRQCAEALSSLTTPPLPDEIAGLLDWAHKVTTLPYNHRDYPGQTNAHIVKLADSLRALAQEIERLKIEGQHELRNNAESYRKRIRELEAERDALKNENDLLESNNTALAMKNMALEAERDRETGRAETAIESLNECRNERDAIKRETIEECIEAYRDWRSVKTYGMSFPNVLRALAHSESEGKEES